jgi:pimeloyl-ACP methyl ester carboxylesterase
MGDDRGQDSGRDLFVTADDGLRLHVREYGSKSDPGLPVVCLPGLTRTAADFEVLAPPLASGSGLKRRVVAIDSRGRGLSEFDRNPTNYNVATELSDLRSILTALSIGPAVYIGSSRGGILTMLMGATNPAAIAGAVLHDIGPVIDPVGLVRIKGYVGKLPEPRSFDDGAEILQRLFGEQFPKLTIQEWLIAARRAWRQDAGTMTPTYDVRIAETLADVDVSKPLPPLWKQFDALAGKPILVIRGGNSDILSAQTVAAMAERHPGLQIIEVPDQGHVPALAGYIVIRIAQFAAVCDRDYSTGSTV